MTKPAGTKALIGLVALLDAHRRVLSKAGAVGNADRLALLSSDLSAVKGDRIAELRKRAENVEFTASVEEADRISAVLPMLAELGEFLVTAGIRGAGADVLSLLGALKPIGGLPLGQAGPILAATPTKKPSARKQTPKAETVRSPREIAERLTKANQDDVAFKALIGELRGKSYQKGTVEAAANIFLGHSENWRYRSKDEAIKKIEARHALDAISDSRQRTINRINA